MDRDGTKNGFDLELKKQVSRAVTVPIIASGGVGNLEHLAEGIVKGEAAAVLAASIFHFGEFTIGQAKAYMAAQGIEVRLWSNLFFVVSPNNLKKAKSFWFDLRDRLGLYFPSSWRERIDSFQYI